MSKMHDNEFEISLELVQKLLNSQCPQYAHLPLKPLASSGTDNALFRLGFNYVVRLPRLPGANSNIEKEWRWLPKLASMLTIPISEPVYRGEPDFNYPSYWSITQWNKGQIQNLNKPMSMLFLQKN